MANDPNVISQQDDWEINMSDAWQVLWWCRYLGLTKSQLEVAINVAGPLIVDIKRHLARQHSMITDTPPAISPVGASHITSRSTLNRSPF